MSLSERIRPNVEAAPWVCAEVKRLEDKVEILRGLYQESEEIASKNYECLEMICEYLISNDLLIINQENGSSHRAFAQNVIDSIEALRNLS